MTGFRTTGGSSLYDRTGRRKYLNLAERRRLLAVAGSLPERSRLFVATLLHSGARLSEVLALTPDSLQPEAARVTFRTLKRRRTHFREVALPPEVMDALAALPAIGGQLFPWSRTTGWRMVSALMGKAGIEGPRATPRGLRHGFGIACITAGIPETLLQRWLGHASLSTTGIYAAAIGEEEASLAARVWRLSAK